MKILFFIESLHAGGKERRLVELIKGLSSYIEIEMELVLTKKEIHYEDIFLTGIKIHYTVRENLRKDPRIFFKFYKIAKDIKPDIIHVWGNLVAFYAIPTKIILRTPLINNQITDAPQKVTKSIIGHKLTFPFSDLIIANSYAGLESYDAPLKKSRVIYNGFDFKRIANLKDKNFIREKFKINTRFVVGMVASFNDKKDYGTYIKAANIVLEQEKDITFICVGSGNSSKYEQLVKSENNDKILFLGKQKDIESIMNICDIGVLITDYEKHGEGISNALLEFSALSKPTIATFGGGNGEIIKQDVTGYLIDQKSYNNLSDKILYLLKNQDLCDDFGDLSKKSVVEKFSIVRMIDEFKVVYNEVLT